jgi:hypothetical protein
MVCPLHAPYPLISRSRRLPVDRFGPNARGAAGAANVWVLLVAVVVAVNDGDK